MGSREVISFLEQRLGPAFEVTRIQTLSPGSRGYSFEAVWARVGREKLREAKAGSPTWR